MGEQGEVVCVFVGLFFSIISATVSTDHLSWKIYVCCFAIGQVRNLLPQEDGGNVLELMASFAF